MRNTRAKINRIKRGFKRDVSDQIEIPKLEDFEYRKDFNAFKASMRNFTNRRNKDFKFVTNKYGVSASVSELERAKSLTDQAIERSKQFIDEVKDYPTYDRGKREGKVGDNIDRMGDGNATGINTPVEFDFNKIQTRVRFDVRVENMERKITEEYYDETKERMKENYLEILELALNSDADEVIEKIKDMSADGFYQMWLQISEIDFNLYSSEGGLTYDHAGGKNAHVEQVMTGIEKFQKEFGKNGNTAMANL